MAEPQVVARKQRGYISGGEGTGNAERHGLGKLGYARVSSAPGFDLPPRDPLDIILHDLTGRYRP